MHTLAQQVGVALQRHGLMLTTAESCTGGAVAAALTDIAGSSAWFERGYVTYANSAKIEMLGVQITTLAQYGAVSEATVREMAIGALTKSHADVALAVSGIAGPGGGTIEKPVGTVWFAWAWRNGEVSAQISHFDGDRSAIRQQACTFVLQGVLDGVLGKH